MKGDKKMEIEGSEGVVARKVWKIVRVVLFMVGQGIIAKKRKLVVEFHMMLKRGKSLVFHHYNAFTCRSHDPHLSFISPRTSTTTHYEFSCSNSPAINPFQAIKRYSFSSKHKNNNKKKKNKSSSLSSQYDDVLTLSAVQKVLEMLNNNNNNNNNENNNSSSSKVVVEAASSSPLVTLPGFGKSPIGRQLRVTDSPFPLNDDADTQVDVAAEEFIKRFYKDLNLQQNTTTMPALHSPYHNTIPGTHHQ